MSMQLPPTGNWNITQQGQGTSQKHVATGELTVGGKSLSITVEGKSQQDVQKKITQIKKYLNNNPTLTKPATRGKLNIQFTAKVKTGFFRRSKTEKIFFTICPKPTSTDSSQTEAQVPPRVNRPVRKPRPAPPPKPNKPPPPPQSKPKALVDKINTKKLESRLSKGEAFAGALEYIQNTSKNLMDVFTLTVPEGSTTESHTEDLFQKLDKFNEDYESKVNPLKFGNKVVQEKDLRVLANFAKLAVTDPKFKSNLRQAIQEKFDQKAGDVYISPDAQAAISLIQSEEDAQKVADHLMSCCTTMIGTCRVIDTDKLRSLLNNPKIKNTPQLRKAVMEEAKKVMIRAARKAQENCVFQGLKKLGRKSEERQWKDKSESMGDRYLNSKGIKVITKKAGLKKFKTNIPENEGNLEILKNVLERGKKVVDVIQETRKQ